MIAIGKFHAPAACNHFEFLLKEQDDTDCRKEEIALEQKWTKAKSEFIIQVNIDEQIN